MGDQRQVVDNARQNEVGWGVERRTKAEARSLGLQLVHRSKSHYLLARKGEGGCMGARTPGESLTCRHEVREKGSFSKRRVSHRIRCRRPDLCDRAHEEGGALGHPGGGMGKEAEERPSKGSDVGEGLHEHRWRGRHGACTSGGGERRWEWGGLGGEEYFSQMGSGWDRQKWWRSLEA